MEKGLNRWACGFPIRPKPIATRVAKHVGDVTVRPCAVSQTPRVSRVLASAGPLTIGARRSAYPTLALALTSHWIVGPRCQSLSTCRWRVGMGGLVPLQRLHPTMADARRQFRGSCCPTSAISRIYVVLRTLAVLPYLPLCRGFRTSRIPHSLSPPMRRVRAVAVGFWCLRHD